jgi:hypothetical protein
VWTREHKVWLRALVFQKVIQTVVDEVEPLIVPMPTLDGGLVGDHAEQKSSVTEGSHGRASSCDQSQFSWAIDVAVEAHVQHAVTVKERDGCIGFASSE